MSREDIRTHQKQYEDNFWFVEEKKKKINILV